MKNFKISLAVIFAAAFALTVAGQTETEIFGYYSIENPTRDFANISEIHLAGTYGAQQKPPVYGLIRLKAKNARDFQLLKPTLNGKNLSFSTTSVGGVNYQFTGTFTKLGNFPELQPNGEVLLTGTLTKYRNKKKVASAVVKLSYQTGD